MTKPSARSPGSASPSARWPLIGRSARNRKPPESARLRTRSWIPLWAGLLTLGAAAAEVPPADAARLLRQRLVVLQPQMQRSPFGMRLLLESVERHHDVRGDVYAVLPHPLADVARALEGAAQWCDVLILHLNVKQCEPTAKGLALNVGRKHDEPLAATYALELARQIVAQTPEYLRLEMSAASGPLGSRDYRFVLEAVAAEGGQTFVHFQYAYGYGLAARLAMQVYFSAQGSTKIGFSPEVPGAGDRSARIGGLRGSLERNTMRYHLAIASYLDSLAQPPEQRVEWRLRDWFAATERFAAQLHEVELDEYLRMKRSQLRRSGSLR